MPRHISLDDFYRGGTALAEPRTTAPKPVRRSVARVPAPVASPISAEALQTTRDVIRAAAAAKRLGERVGVSPGQLGLIALAGLAAFGGYKWYKAKKASAPRPRRIKASLIGG